jgi:hypothetical protein
MTLTASTGAAAPLRQLGRYVDRPGPGRVQARAEAVAVAVDGEESAVTVTVTTVTVTVTPETGKPAAAFAAAVRSLIGEDK